MLQPRISRPGKGERKRHAARDASIRAEAYFPHFPSISFLVAVKPLRE